MFEQATKQRLRFNSSVGQVTTEDLWDIDLTGRELSLDNIAKGISRELKASEEESFVLAKSNADSELELKLEIVKRVITIKMDEIEASKNAVERKAKKEKILSILSGKEDDELASKTSEELKGLLGEL